MLVWKGHRAKVRSLAFSPDGRYVATTAGESKFVWLWEASTGKVVHKLPSSVWAMRSAAFLPDGLTCAAGGENGQVVVWDVDE